ncbi:MAG TPA: TonB-dependent receptor, partial [Rhodothermales bacterium]|nr:TonB-dependent receptor [Rhodothermales bacterium]
NVRVRYSGLNDSKGFVGGFDVQVRGEFVPGLESWLNYGFLVAKEHFLEGFENKSKQGWIVRPTDQRHTFSLYVQDYVPGDRTWRLHLRALYGSGYPYSPLVPISGSGGNVFLGPGRRNAFRFEAYKRLDAGVTKEIAFGSSRLDVTAELLNGFDMTNEVGSRWVYGGGRWNRVPIRLTPRTFNVRMRLMW